MLFRFGPGLARGILFPCAVLLVGVGFLLPSAVTAAPDLAIVLNGSDNTLSTTELPVGSTSLGVAGFAGFPGEGVIAGDRYYAVVSGADRVVVFDLATLAPLDTLHTGAGTNPWGVVVDGAGNVFVSLLVADEVVRFNAAGVETHRTPVGRSPQGLLLHLGDLYVASTGFRFTDYGYDPGKVFRIDPGTLALTDSVVVGTNPQWLDAEGGNVHAMCTGDYFSVFGEVHVVDCVNMTVGAVVTLGGSPGFVLLDGDYGYTTDYSGGIYRYRLSDLAVLNDSVTPIQFGGTGYSRMAADGAGYLYVTLYGDDLIARLETTGYTVDATYATGDGPGSISLRTEAPVPVRLLSFTAEAAEGQVSLHWETADDHDVAAWWVERSVGTANETWETLARLAPNARSFRDTTAPNGTVRYRLAALERDGARVNLAERLVEPGAPALAVKPMANPARGALRFAVSGQTAGAVVRMMDARGRLVRSMDAVTDGEFDLTGIPAGIYFLRITNAGRTASARVTVLP